MLRKQTNVILQLYLIGRLGNLPTEYRRNLALGESLKCLFILTVHQPNRKLNDLNNVNTTYLFIGFTINGPILLFIELDMPQK